MHLAGGRAALAVLIATEPAEDQRARAGHSFLAMLFCVPVFTAVHLVGRSTDIDWPREGASFVLGWLGYAVLSHHLAARMGRAALWPRFITLWNWCNLVQYLLMVAALAPPWLGMAPVVGQTAWLVALGWSLWLQWSATRLTLALAGGSAALMVAADMALGLVVLRFTVG